MTLPSETQVLIVGAGPSGLSLAIRLAASGVGFVLVDKLTEPRTTSRAAAIHTRTLRTFEPLGLTDTLIGAGRRVTAAAIWGGDRVLTRIRFDKLNTAYPFVLALPQNETEAILARRLESLGGTVARGWTVTALHQDTGGVTATLEAADGDTATVRARYVAGTDGYHSVTRSAAGIGFKPGTYPRSFVLADVTTDRAFPVDEMDVFLSHEGLMFIVPFKDERIRVIATMEHADPEPDTAAVQAVMDARLPGRLRARIKGMHWSSRFRIHHGVADTYRSGRILLAGDAAHVHSPAGGQGMNIGIQDAVSLGEHLTSVIRDQAPALYLDNYQAVRRPVAEKVVTMTDRMTRLATIESPLLRGARDLALQAAGLLPGIKAKVAAQIAEVDG